MARGKMIFIRPFLLIMPMLAALLLACGEGQTQEKIYTIGVVHYNLPLEPAFEGLKEGLAELGYEEGKNIAYIYDGPVAAEEIDSEVENLLAQDVDLLFTMGNPTTLAARQAVMGTNIPVVFAPTIDPIGAGIVEDLRQPGGNVTGVQRANAIPKSLEWLLELVPGMSAVYVPYHPDDAVAVQSIEPLPEAASELGIDLILDKVHSPEEMVAVVETLSEDTVIFFIPSPSIEPGRSMMIEAATEQHLAVGSYTLEHIDIGAVATCGPTFFDMGKQAARLVDQIFKGTKPADLPVETSEVFFAINLKTAATIGLDIPDELLGRANIIVR
ncbi:MAG: ABC transporter substrate-binding protein [Anaerolineae bacterium]|nr:ABC transporter substrate-binding protein [Anaerolineae bacterium]